MKIESVRNVIEQSRLIKRLASHDNLIFVGEKDILEFFGKILKSSQGNQTDYNYYSVWDQTLENINLPDKLASYKAIIVISETDENTLFNSVKNYRDKLSINIPVLKLFSDLFVNLMIGQPLLTISQNDFKKPNQGYAILTTPRSGSTLLCSLLESTKIAGFPAEHLRRESQILSENANFDYISYLEKLMTYVVTDNGVFGTKFISHFLKRHEKSGGNFEKIFQEYLPKIIYLKREDKLAQTVSIFIAQTTGFWHSYQIKDQEKYQEKLSEIKVDQINLQQLNSIHQGIYQGEKYLQSIINKYEIEACYITYEDLLENTEKNFKNILAYLGLEAPEKLNLKAKTKKLRSPLTQEIIDRYLEIYNEIGEKKWD